jgi:hypothetical protein
MKKANHTAPIVRIGDVLAHPNADKLEITHVKTRRCSCKSVRREYSIASELDADKWDAEFREKFRGRL